MTKKIKITDLMPILRPGFIAKDAYGDWCWYSHKPKINHTRGVWVVNKGDERLLSAPFSIAKSEIEWDKSLIRIKRQ